MDEVTIIGAGPAGIACALQLARQGICPVLLEGDSPGGLLRNANLVENYPGFPGGIPGPELAGLFLAQLASVGIIPKSLRVLLLDHREGAFLLQTGESSFSSRIVVVASGTRPIPLEPGRVAPEAGGLVFYEIVPLADKENKRIVIVGGGDAAFDYALNLGRRNEVVILNRGAKTRALPLLKERVAGAKRIRYIPGAQVEAVRPDQRQGLIIGVDEGGKRSILPADYLVCAIGRAPEAEFVSPGLKDARDLTERGLIHFIGDVKNGMFRQTAIAVGDGIRAALMIAEKLRKERDE